MLQYNELLKHFRVKEHHATIQRAPQTFPSHTRGTVFPTPVLLVDSLG